MTQGGALAASRACRRACKQLVCRAVVCLLCVLHPASDSQTCIHPPITHEHDCATQAVSLLQSGDAELAAKSASARELGGSRVIGRRDVIYTTETDTGEQVGWGLRMRGWFAAATRMQCCSAVLTHTHALADG
jgi:hypothetical protein